MLKFLKIKKVAALGLSLMLSLGASATEIQIQTTEGNIDINLFDSTTPQTVENFLNYVNGGDYQNTAFHRVVNGFVAQSGGFQINDGTASRVPARATVQNEPVLSNVRGTIAMAKVGGNPNSATSEWFISLADNSANLDLQNGGFTAFGQVLGNGMDVVAAIVELPRNSQGYAISGNNAAIITNIVVTDAATNTNTDLNPARNTLITQQGGNGDGDADSSGGGSFGWLLISLFGLRILRNRHLK